MRTDAFKPTLEPILEEPAILDVFVLLTPLYAFLTARYFFDYLEKKQIEDACKQMPSQSTSCLNSHPLASLTDTLGIRKHYAVSNPDAYKKYLGFSRPLGREQSLNVIDHILTEIGDYIYHEVCEEYYQIMNEPVDQSDITFLSDVPSTDDEAMKAQKMKLTQRYEQISGITNTMDEDKAIEIFYSLNTSDEEKAACLKHYIREYYTKRTGNCSCLFAKSAIDTIDRWSGEHNRSR